MDEFNKPLKETEKFTWWTKDNKRHEQIVERENVLDFIEWLEYDPEIVKWQ